MPAIEGYAPGGGGRVEGLASPERSQPARSSAKAAPAQSESSNSGGTTQASSAPLVNASEGSPTGQRLNVVA